MSRLRLVALASVVAVMAVFLAPVGAHANGLEVVATGLDNPRGLAFAADGSLLVAEAGRGGSGPCIEGPEGEVCLGFTGAVTRVKNGDQSRLIDGLPSLADESGFGAAGPHDVSPLASGHVAVAVGIGSDGEGRAALGPDAVALGHVIKVNGRSGTWKPMTDLLGFEVENNPDAGDLSSEIDSNPNSVLSLPGRMIAVDAGGNDLLEIKANGDTSVLAVFREMFVPVPFPPFSFPMQAVPTSVVQGPDGAFYVGQLTGFPFPPGGASVWRVVPGEAPTAFASGFTNIIDLAFGADGTLYVLGIGLSGPPSLWAVPPGGGPELLLTDTDGLLFPSGLAVGPDGALYISNFGIFPGAGQVVRFVP